MNDYIKAIKKMAVSLFGEVDDHAYDNEELESILDNYFRNMSHIPETRLTKAVDNFILKGKTKNSWFFSDYAVIKFNREEKKILIEQPNITAVSEIALDPNGVAVELYSLEKFEKGIKLAKVITGQFEAYSSEYNLTREYRFKKETPSFEDCYDKFIYPFILEEVGDNFLSKSFEEARKQEIYNFPAQDDFNHITFRVFDENGKSSLAIIHPEYKDVEKRLRIPKMQQELFFMSNGRFYHKTIGEMHTKHGLKHFEETGENIFRGTLGASLFILKTTNPAEYYGYTNNPELIRKMEEKIAEKARLLEKEKHEQMLREAGKQEEKTKTTSRRKTKVKESGTSAPVKPEEKPQPKKKQTAKTITAKKKAASKKTTTQKKKPTENEKGDD